MTGLMLINALRINLEYGIGDEWRNAAIFFLGTTSTAAIAYLPMHVTLTAFIPDNIETSAMAVITAAFYWSYLVMAKITAAWYCIIFELDDQHMENYPKVIIAKMVMLFPMTAYLFIYPRNEDVYKRADKLRLERLKLRKQTDQKYMGIMERDKASLMDAGS